MQLSKKLFFVNKMVKKNKSNFTVTFTIVFSLKPIRFLWKYDNLLKTTEA